MGYSDSKSAPKRRAGTLVSSSPIRNGENITKSQTQLSDCTRVTTKNTSMMSNVPPRYSSLFFLPHSGKGKRAGGHREDHEVVSVEGASLTSSQKSLSSLGLRLQLPLTQGMPACQVTSVVSNSLHAHGLEPTRLLCPWGFSRQEYWSGLPCPPPGDLLNPGIKPMSLMSPALADGFFTTSTTTMARYSYL